MSINKNWFQNNLGTIIIGAMITAFFINWQVERANARADTRETQRAVNLVMADHEKRITILENVMIMANPNLDDWQKQALLEYMRTRGGIVIPTSKKVEDEETP